MKRATRIRLLIFALMGGLAVINAGVRYTGLYQMVFPSSYTVQVHLAKSGGLFPHSEVTWRGVTVGHVTALTFESQGVVATLSIGDQYKIPAKLAANVHNRSAVGEQYIDLVPTTAAGPLLHNGSVIEAAHTTTPVPDEQVISALDQLERSVNLNDLHTVITETNAIFGGAGGALSRLIDNSSTILAAAHRALPATTSLLKDGRTVLQTQDEQSAQIRGYLDDLNTLFGVLNRHDGDLRTILTTGTTASRAITSLADGLATDLPGLLVNLSTLASLTSSRLPGIQETLAVLPWALAMAQTPGRDGYAHFTFVGTPSPGPCQKGYLPPAQWLSPLNPATSTLPDTISCNEALSTNPRGANSVHPTR